MTDLMDQTEARMAQNGHWMNSAKAAIKPAPKVRSG
jgi:hypothetical protein